MILRRLLTKPRPVPELPENASEEAVRRWADQWFTEAQESLYCAVKQDARRTIRFERRNRSGFEKRLNRRWKEAISAYELFVITARTSGEKVLREGRDEAVRTEDYVFEALTRIHARSCLIASEIRALLVSGHASGAMTRWRSLHELAVVASFLREYGDDVAERYMLHEAIKRAKAAEEFQKYAFKSGYDPLEPEYLDRLREERATLLERYGADYGEDYGWATSVMKGRPTFARIEAAVGLDHWRPPFSTASDSVHAGFRGMVSDLGYTDSLSADQTMLAGPSQAGLADPGSNASQSLLTCTVALLGHKPTPQSAIAIGMLNRLALETADIFVRTHWALRETEDRTGVRHGQS